MSDEALIREQQLRVIRRDLTAMNWHRVPDEAVIAVAVALWGATMSSAGAPSPHHENKAPI